MRKDPANLLSIREVELNMKLTWPSSHRHFLNIDPDNDGEDEGVKGYKRGGYHPVYIGELINDRYVVV